MAMQLRLSILSLIVFISGVTQANDTNIEQAASMSNVVKMLHEQEKSSRSVQKPMSEMSDEEVVAEVVAQAAEKTAYTVGKIAIGARSAIERLQKKAVSAAADAIRNQSVPRTSNMPQNEKNEEAVPGIWIEESSMGKNSGLGTGNGVETTATDMRTASDKLGERMVVFAVVAFVVAVILYGIAYMRVTSGTMVVYSSWGDFAASAAWVVLFLVGAGCRYAAEDAGGSLMTAGTVLLWCGGFSAAWMVLGAIQNKSIVDIVFAVPARIIVAVLVLFAWSKLKESLDGLRDGRKGVVDGVLIPLGIALFVFNSLVKPMVGDRRASY